MPVTIFWSLQLLGLELPLVSVPGALGALLLWYDDLFSWVSYAICHALFSLLAQETQGSIEE